MQSLPAFFDSSSSAVLASGAEGARNSSRDRNRGGIGPGRSTFTHSACASAVASALHWLRISCRSHAMTPGYCVIRGACATSRKPFVACHSPRSCAALSTHGAPMNATSAPSRSPKMTRFDLEIAWNMLLLLCTREPSPRPAGAQRSPPPAGEADCCDVVAERARLPADAAPLDVGPRRDRTPRRSLRSRAISDSGLMPATSAVLTRFTAAMVAPVQGSGERSATYRGVHAAPG